MENTNELILSFLYMSAIPGLILKIPYKGILHFNYLLDS